MGKPSAAKIDDSLQKYLRFPIEQTSELKSKIVFQPYKVQGSKFSFESVDTSTVAGITAASKSPDKKVKAGTTPISTVKLDEKTEIFLPLQFQVRDNIQYNNASQLGLVGGQAFGAVAGGAGLRGGLIEGIQQMGDSVANLFGVLAGTRELGALAAARTAQLPGVPQVARDVIGLAGRIIINPNVRTTFQGVAVRDFTFQFDFYPKSEMESIVVHNIVRNFRLNAYPKPISGSRFVPVGYKYPNIYKIRLLSGNDDSKLFKNVGTPIKLAYLQNIDTNYARQQGEGLFKSGAPTHVSLSLTFVEYKALDRDDIEAENTDGFYDYEGQKTEQ